MFKKLLYHYINSLKAKIHTEFKEHNVHTNDKIDIAKQIANSDYNGRTLINVVIYVVICLLSCLFYTTTLTLIIIISATTLLIAEFIGNLIVRKKTLEQIRGEQKE